MTLAPLKDEFELHWSAAPDSIRATTDDMALIMWASEIALPAARRIAKERCMDVLRRGNIQNERLNQLVNLMFEAVGYNIKTREEIEREIGRNGRGSLDEIIDEARACSDDQRQFARYLFVSSADTWADVIVREIAVSVLKVTK